MNKEVRKLVQSISGIEGVEVKNGSKHLHVFKDGVRVAVLPSTPSDHRSLLNARAQLRSVGITPSVNPKANSVAVTYDLMPIADIRARLDKVVISEFARFLVDEVAPVSGLASYKNATSAASALRQLHAGKSEGLTEWAHVLVDRGFRMQDRINGLKHKADRADVREAVVAEPVPEPASEPRLELSVDLAKLTAALADFGITLKVE